ncbi:hypothetical protein ONZ43_g2473 [Nemania bipapillata]|uniref:Uncharacterized protein n=1 Tax=Nemania bipapillata TaxID=110536 RepID=A0ACC2J0I0_9PEZI|nr:hypothetical protein ONZ43_g2473 [Nemania bipapillata]
MEAAQQADTRDQSEGCQRAIEGDITELQARERDIGGVTGMVKTIPHDQEREDSGRGPKQGAEKIPGISRSVVVGLTKPSNLRDDDSIEEHGAQLPERRKTFDAPSGRTYHTTRALRQHGEMGNCEPPK